MWGIPVFTLEEAKHQAMSGKDIWTLTKYDAYLLAKAIQPGIPYSSGGPDKLYSPIYPNGFIWGANHYNPKRPAIFDEKASIHIFYGTSRVSFIEV